MKPARKGFVKAEKRNGRATAQSLAPLRARRGAWCYAHCRPRVEDIFHLYDSDGSGELELNEYYILDHILNRFDEKGIARFARKVQPSMSWGPDEERERVRSQFKVLWDRDKSDSVSIEEFHVVVEELLKHVHSKKKGQCGWSGVDRLLTQLESGPNETGITELRMHWDTLEHEQPKGIMDIGVENVTLNQVFNELSSMEAKFEEVIEYEAMEQRELEDALIKACDEQRVTLFMHMCLQGTTAEQADATRERLHNLEASLAAHVGRLHERLRALMKAASPAGDADRRAAEEAAARRAAEEEAARLKAQQDAANRAAQEAAWALEAQKLAVTSAAEGMSAKQPVAKRRSSRSNETLDRRPSGSWNLDSDRGKAEADRALGRSLSDLSSTNVDEIFQ